MKCPKCGAETADYSPFCANCGATIRELESPPQEVSIENASPTYEASIVGKYTIKPVIGGLLVFLVALGCLIFNLKSLSEILSDPPPASATTLRLAFDTLITLILSLSTLSAISIIGSFFAFTRKNFPLSVLGSVASFMVGLLTFGTLGALAAIPGLVLISISAKEMS